MSIPQLLGGARHSAPLDDEMSYPLTSDEYLLIKENLVFDKFTNWESFLITTGITSLISFIIIWATGSFEKVVTVDGKEVININMVQVVITVIYGALTLGSLLGFFIFKLTKKKSENTIQRLEIKITRHLTKIEE